MQYVEPVLRPPSEAGSFLVQATIGCSWNNCTYCAMYRDKQYRMRPLAETLEDIALAGRSFGDHVRKVFVLDGDALAMPLEIWEPILESLSTTFPKLRRVSCYATALNLLEKSQQELERLRELGLELLYIGPESGDDVTLKRIAKGASAAEHVEAAAKARDAGMKQSLIFLLGAGGTERTVEHATASARLATAMDAEFLSALTLMLIPSTPIHRLAEHGDFELPSVDGILRELRIIVAEANPSDAVFRSNHASNYLPIGGRLPRVTPDGKRRRPHLLRVVLSCSRKAYSEVIPRQTTEHFIRALENAFWHFGGVPQTLVTDNLKAAVTKADWFDPELNPKILAFCAHYGTTLVPTRPRLPRHKGKVERGVGYAQSNALKGRTFDSLAAQNRFLEEWETSVADTRIHGTTRRQVSKLFTELEQSALLPLPAARFPFFYEGERIVNRDGHVEVAKAYYSAPPEFVGRKVWVRWDGHVVRIFDRQLQQIAIHAQHEPGRFRPLRAARICCVARVHVRSVKLTASIVHDPSCRMIMRTCF
jgi:hypothetical protein